MKKMIALITALMMVLSLTACFGSSSTDSTADEAKAADISAYDDDFEGLLSYITDNNSGCMEQEIYYGILGADNGKRVIFNNNPYVEIYDFSSVVDSAATADSADPAKAKEILADIKDDGKFKPMADGIEMTAVITDSGKYVIAWDASRGFDYEKKVATDEVKAKW
ncbi:MAG: hypothetical protein IJH07_00745 [Ruminococcus sp.]|nr:hypothetical protein [Ruminococcus sp.]